jgi:cytochrome c oxidase cbb3-type subunit I/II
MPENLTALGTKSQTHAVNGMERLIYRDGSIHLFILASACWGVIATVVFLLSGLLLSMPSFYGNLSDELLSIFTFARLDAMRSNLAVFAFGGNAVFAGVYYSIQRLCKAPLWSNFLALLHFIVWQAILVALVASPMMGFLQGRSLSGGPWPIDVAIAATWVGCFGVNCGMTIANRRERYLYVSLWFYLASIVAVGILQIANCIVSPSSLLRSVPLLSGVQDAWMSNWYKHGMVSFLLTVPFVGLVYYFLPKAVDRPLYSYKLTIVHFWSLIALLICAGTSQMHFTTVPDWASTFGMLCGVMLWMPLWAGVVNGLCTLSGAWGKVKQDPALRFLVVGLLLFGFTSLESSILSIKSVHARIHFSDWEVAHWDTVVFGWLGMTCFGVFYWMMPRLMKCNLHRFSHIHFYLAVVGTLLIAVPEYASGFIQARKWSQLSEMGKLEYSFIETLQSVVGLWWIRLIGGAVYLLGLAGLAGNILLHLGAKRIFSEANLPQVLPRGEKFEDSAVSVSVLAGKPVLEFASKLDQFSKLDWHRKLERQPARLVLSIALVVILLCFTQVILVLASGEYAAPIPSVQPYTPLELMGREIYIAQGCQQCHSQMVRPLVYESQRYGAISQAGEAIFDRPSLWGEHRIGPDLAREGGGRQSSYWHWRHFENAPAMTKESVMPIYKHLLAEKLPFAEIGKRIRDVAKLGTPYDLRVEEGETIESKFEAIAHKQAEMIAAEIISQGGPVAHQGNLIKDTSAVALIAYLQRLGTDLSRPTPASNSGESKTNSN